MDERRKSSLDSIDDFGRFQAIGREKMADGPYGTLVPEPAVQEGGTRFYDWAAEEAAAKNTAAAVYDWSVRYPQLRREYDTPGGGAAGTTETARLAGGFGGRAKITGGTVSQAGKQFRLPLSEPSKMPALPNTAGVRSGQTPAATPRLEFHNVENVFQHLPAVYERVKAEQAKRHRRLEPPPTPQS